MRLLSILKHEHFGISEKELYGAYKIFFGTLVSESRLKKCGFVIQEIKGKFRYYKLNEKTIKPLIEIIDKHMAEFCVHILMNKKEVRK